MIFNYRFAVISDFVSLLSKGGCSHKPCYLKGQSLLQKETKINKKKPHFAFSIQNSNCTLMRALKRISDQLRFQLIRDLTLTFRFCQTVNKKYISTCRNAHYGLCHKCEPRRTCFQALRGLALLSLFGVSTRELCWAWIFPFKRAKTPADVDMVTHIVGHLRCCSDFMQYVQEQSSVVYSTLRTTWWEVGVRVGESNP